ARNARRAVRRVARLRSHALLAHPHLSVGQRPVHALLSIRRSRARVRARLARRSPLESAHRAPGAGAAGVRHDGGAARPGALCTAQAGRAGRRLDRCRTRGKAWPAWLTLAGAGVELVRAESGFARSVRIAKTIAKIAP